LNQQLGQKYFEENKGHFWRLVETRPYMRAQEFLTTSLKVAGQLKEAIKQAEKSIRSNTSNTTTPQEKRVKRYYLKWTI